MLRFLTSQYLRLKATMLCYYAKTVENLKEKNDLSVTSERKPSFEGRRATGTGKRAVGEKEQAGWVQKEVSYRAGCEWRGMGRGEFESFRIFSVPLSTVLRSMPDEALQDISALGSGPTPDPCLLTQVCPTGSSATCPQRLLNTGHAQHEQTHLLQRILSGRSIAFPPICSVGVRKTTEDWLWQGLTHIQHSLMKKPLETGFSIFTKVFVAEKNIYWVPDFCRCLNSL